MVVHIGIYIDQNGFCSIIAYDNVTKEDISYDLQIKKTDFKYSADHLFLKIKQRVNDNIGCCCFCDWDVDYLKIRKNILEDGKSYGFSKIQFLDKWCAKYIYAMFSNNVTPKFNDIIWIELETIEKNNYIHYGIFQKMQDEAKLLKTIILNISYKKALTTMRPPTFIINGYSDQPRDMSLLSKMFPYCKIYDYDPNESKKGFLLKAKIMAGQKELQPFDIKSGVLHNIHFQIDNLEIFTIPEYFTFPFTKSIWISNSLVKEKLLEMPKWLKPSAAKVKEKLIKPTFKITSGFLNCHSNIGKHEIKIIFTRNPRPEIITFDIKGNSIMNFIVDTNGIYSIKILPQNNTFLPLVPILISIYHLTVYDITCYIPNDMKQKNLFLTTEARESEIIFLFDANLNVENYITNLFGRKKIMRIDLKEIRTIRELICITRTRKGYLLNFVTEHMKFSDVAYIFENIDQCQNESVKSFMINLLNTRKIQYETFYSPLFECLIAVTVNDRLFLTIKNIEKMSDFISESAYKVFLKMEIRGFFSSSILPACLTQRDTLSLESYQRFFAVSRNINNYNFNILNIQEQNKTQMFHELIEIFQKAFVKKSFTLSDFTSMVEAEIEEMLPSYENLHKWLSTSSHSTKKLLCYAGDAIHFGLLDSEHVQLKFPETSEKFILVKNFLKFDPILPFHYLPSLSLHVKEAFICPELLQKISIKIEGVYLDYIDQFDQRTFAELSSAIAQEITEMQQKPWGCYLSNSTSLMKYNFPAEFIHYFLPSAGIYFSLVVYCHVIPSQIHNCTLKPNAKIVGTFKNDVLQNYGNKLLMLLYLKNQNGLKKGLTQLFQTEKFTMLSGFSFEGFEYYEDNFILKNYIYISCNDISLLAFV